MKRAKAELLTIVLVTTCGSHQSAGKLDRWTSDGGTHRILGCMTAAFDYSELHRLVDRMEPDQAAELKEHALRLVGGRSRFRVLRAFDGPPADLGARAKQLVRADLGEDDAAR